MQQIPFSAHPCELVRTRAYDPGVALMSQRGHDGIAPGPD